MSWVAVGVAAVSTAVTISGNNEARRAQAKAAERQAKRRQQQATRMLEQNAVNRFTIGVQGEEAKSSQLVSFSKAGVDLSSGSVLQVLADTQAQVFSNQYLSKEEAKFNAQQMINEGQALKEGARSIRRGQDLSNAASMFQGAVQAYNMKSGGGSASGSSK